MRALRPTFVEQEIKPLAIVWVASARAILGGGDEALLRAALEANFAWRSVPDELRPQMLAFVSGHFDAIERILAASDRHFRQAFPWDVRRWFGTAVPPAYTLDGQVNFTDEFRPRDAATGGGFGPLCLTAMVIHECVHVFDERSGEAEIHISEWDEPRFSANPPELQMHNPSAYASFAAQVHHARHAWPVEARFGAGRPAD